MISQDRYLPADIKALLGITSASALRDNIKNGKVPKPEGQGGTAARGYRETACKGYGGVGLSVSDS